MTNEPGKLSKVNLFGNEGIIPDPLLNTVDYAELINSNMYVDKTMFINAILDDGNKMVMISAPRLFCKSSNMNMLRKFVEIELDSNGDSIKLQYDETGFLKEDQPTSKNFKLFQNKKIFTVENNNNLIFNKKFFTDHFGRYSIIFVDFSNVRGNTYEEIVDSLGEAVRNSFLEHLYLKNSPMLSEDDKNTFNKYIKRYELLTAVQIKNGLRFLSGIIRKHFGNVNKIYVLIDGFDAPISNSMNNQSIDEVILQNTIYIIQILIELLLHNNLNIDRALLNCSNHIGTALTSCAVHKPFVQNEIYWEFYGFTQLDVIYLLKKVGLLKQFKNVEKHYGGYCMKSNFFYKDIFCPWSVLNYLKTQEFGKFWFEDNFNLLRFSNYEFIRPIIDHLMHDLPVIMPYKCTLNNTEIIALSKIFTKNAMKSSQTDLFIQFLYGIGYLKVDKLRDLHMRLKVPNFEILSQFKSVIDFQKSFSYSINRPRNETLTQ